jgi:ABC-type lipoprotein release transport system permease subunit
MQAIALKILFRKKSTASAIIAVALLIALLASVNALVNNINSQTTLIAKLANQGDSFIITSKDSTSLFDSKIPANLIESIKTNPQVSYATAQQTTEATIKTNTTTYQATVRGVSDVRAFLTNQKASINGSVSGENQATIGIIFAKLASVNKNDMLNLTINGKSVQLKVTAITQSNQQSDTQITISLSTLQAITQNNSEISLIHFKVKDAAKANTVIENLTQAIPTDIKITSLQQVPTFATDVNKQTATFINVWSVAIYLVVIAASYIIASRAVNDARYELYTLRTIGTKRKTTLSMITVYALTIGLIGSVIGISLGIVGTQTASTLIRWNWGNTLLNPILNVNQALEILLLALVASLVGCIYPAIKGSKIIAKETTL